MKASCTICRKTWNKEKCSMFKVPSKEEDRKLWSEACGLELHKSARICEKHFRWDDFNDNTTKRRRLKNDVVPTLNLHRASETPEKSTGKETGTRRRQQIEFVNLQVDPFREANNNSAEEMLHDEPSVDYSSLQFASKAVQTGTESTRTCGYIEASTDFQLYSMNCFYCAEVFPIWNWGEFVTHLKDNHQKAEEQFKQDELEELEESQLSKSDILIVDATKTDIDSLSNSLSIIEDTASKKAKEKDHEVEFIEHQEDENSQLNWNDFEDHEDEEMNGTGINTSSTFFSNSFEDSDDDDAESSKSKEALSSNASQSVKAPLTVPCYLCEKFFRDETHLQAHKLMRHNVVQLPVRPGRRERSGKLNCDICNMTFRQPSRYKKHMLVHQPPAYKCHICSRNFRWKLSFMDHLKLHTDQRDYVCHTPCKKFLRAQRLMDHKKNVHSQSRDYLCSICNIAFKTSTHLCWHRKKCHLVLEGTIEQLTMRESRKRGRSKYKFVIDPTTNTKRIQCEICGNTYSRHGGLLVHMVNAHGHVRNKLLKQLAAGAKRPDAQQSEDEGSTEYIIMDNETEVLQTEDDIIEYDDAEDDGRGEAEHGTTIQVEYFENVV